MTSLHIAFADTFEQDTTVAVLQEGELPEFLQIWVWDLYYASTLHTLAETPEAAHLRQTLEGWAGTVVGNILDPETKFREKGLLSIDVDLVLVEGVGEALHEVYSIETEDNPESGWPDIRVSSSRNRSPNRLAYSPIALAQYFIDANVLFAKELPLHILSMRKYYDEQRPPSEDVSRMEAPLYAINKAMKFFQDLKDSDNVSVD